MLLTRGVLVNDNEKWFEWMFFSSFEPFLSLVCDGGSKAGAVRLNHILTLK